MDVFEYCVNRLPMTYTRNCSFMANVIDIPCAGFHGSHSVSILSTSSVSNVVVLLITGQKLLMRYLFFFMYRACN